MPAPDAGPSAGGLHVVARIGRPHGVRGEVTVQLHTDDPAGRFLAGAVLLTRTPAGAAVPEALTVRSARLHSGRWVLGFSEVSDRTGAEALRGTRLLVEPDAPHGEEASRDEQEGWYEEQLVGIAVEGTDGRVLGTVRGLRPGPAQDLLLLDLSHGGTASVPFVTALVPVVDVPGRRIVVDPPPGLLDLDA